jgi:thioredoxin-like negative regulator of GroEL
MADAVDRASSPWWVIALCAQWCNVCRDWRPTFDEVAAARPDMNFAWVDVEDEDEAMGDVDIETFPTVLVGRGREALFLGPVQPGAAQLSRLLASLKHAQTDEALSRPPVSGEAAPLLARLHAGVLPKP